MNRYKRPERAQKERKAPSKFRKALIGFFGGTFLVREDVLRHAPFIGFLVLLSIGYIAYGYHSERTVKEFYRLESKVKDLKTQEITLKSDLEHIKQESRVAESIKELGLTENVEQPFKLQSPEEE